MRKRGYVCLLPLAAAGSTWGCAAELASVHKHAVTQSCFQRRLVRRGICLSSMRRLMCVSAVASGRHACPSLPLVSHSLRCLVSPAQVSAHVEAQRAQQATVQPHPGQHGAAARDCRGAAVRRRPASCTCTACVVECASDMLPAAAAPGGKVFVPAASEQNCPMVAAASEVKCVLGRLADAWAGRSVISGQPSPAPGSFGTARASGWHRCGSDKHSRQHLWPRL